MERLIRECFTEEGYIFATKAVDIARKLGHTRLARLASNESPFPPSQNAITAAKDELETVNRYPDERMESLIKSLRKYHGEYRFVTGVGMDGVIETIIRMFIGQGDRVAISTPTFSFYGIASKAQGGELTLIPRRDDFSVDIEDFIRKSEGAKLSFICSPNNPTGNATPPEDIEYILEHIDGLLFLDNAYVEFCDYDYRPLMDRYRNLVIGRTMSKAFSLAGLRVGYAFVPPWLEPYYWRAATPFTLNSVSAMAAAGALSDKDHVMKIVQHVRTWRARYLEEIPYTSFPSDANFVMVDVAPHNAEDVVLELARKGIIVRSCTSFPGLEEHYIRVGIGEDWECERFLEEIRTL